MIDRFKSINISLMGMLNKLEHPTRLQTILVCIFLMALGLLLRLPGYDGRALWVDELWRVNLILDSQFWHRYAHTPDLYTAITAPIYALVNQLIALIYVSPKVMRLSSLAPGLFAIGLMFYIAIRAGGGLLVAIMGGLIVAVNADFIEYSNQFKPYMFEVMTHLICLATWVVLLKSPVVSAKKITLFFVILIFALLSCANSIFIFPSIGVTVILWALFCSQSGKRNLILVSIGFVILGLVAGVMYRFIWSYGSDKELLNYWGNGFWSSAYQNHFSFWLDAYSRMWAGSFNAFNSNLALAKCALIIFILTVVTVIINTISRRRGKHLNFPSLIFFYALIFSATVMALNYLGMWPIGRLRPNLFIYAQFIAVFVMLISQIPYRRIKNFFALVVILFIAVRIAQVSPEQLSNLSSPREETDLVFADFSKTGKVGKIIQEQCEKNQKVVVFFNPAAAAAYDYFFTKDSRKDDFMHRVVDCITFIPIPNAYSNPQVVNAAIRELTESNVYFWIGYSHLSDKEIQTLVELASKSGRLDCRGDFVGAGYFRIDKARHSSNLCRDEMRCYEYASK